MRKWAEQVLFYLILVMVWQVVVALRIWPNYLLPSPLMVLEALWYGIQDRTFVIGAGISMRRIALGYGLSVVLGVTLGLLIATSDFLESTLGKLVLGLQSPTQHLLAAAGGAVVRPERKRHSIRRADGVGAGGRDQHRDRRAARAAPVSQRGAQSRRARPALFAHVLLPAALPLDRSG